MEKVVMVIGAGPAGMECARVAAERGHEVHLYDEKDIVGGQIFHASRAPYGDEELYGVIDYLKTQCEKSGVNMHLGTAVSPEMIDEEMPDAVVIATGAQFKAQDVPGLDKAHLVSALDVLEDKAETGDRVVIWGGRKPSIAAALFLAQKNKKITIISKDRKVGKDVNPSYIWRYIQKLRQKGVKTYKNSDIEEIEANSVTIKGLHGVRIPVLADTIVYAEREAVAHLKDKAKELSLETHVIGDALVPRGLSHALHDGYRTGVRL